MGGRKMISGIFRALANLHGDTDFDKGVAKVCNDIADALESMGL